MIKKKNGDNLQISNFKKNMYIYYGCMEKDAFYNSIKYEKYYYHV